MTDLSRRLVLGAALAGLSGCAPLVLRPETNAGVSDAPRFDGDAFISFDGAHLPLSRWAPEGPVRRVIVALHGMNDYAMAFQDDGPVFASRGVATYAYDQRGFGRGPHRGLWAGRDLLTADVKAAVLAARRQHPGIPVTVLGHSMGGAVAISAFADPDPPLADGLILAAPAIWGWSAQPALNRVALWLSAHVTPGAHLSPPAWVARKYQSSDNIPVLIRMGRDPNLLFTTRIDAVYGRFEIAKVIMRNPHQHQIGDRALADLIIEIAIKLVNAPEIREFLIIAAEIRIRTLYQGAVSAIINGQTLGKRIAFQRYSALGRVLIDEVIRHAVIAYA